MIKKLISLTEKVSPNSPRSWFGGLGFFDKIDNLHVDQFLKSQHDLLFPDYKYADGAEAECAILAVETALRMRREDMVPTIYLMSSRVPFTPLEFNPTVKFYSHVVAGAEGMIFDPIVGHSVDRNEYSEKVFGKNMRFSLLVPKQNQESFINAEAGKFSELKSLYHTFINGRADHKFSFADQRLIGAHPQQFENAAEHSWKAARHFKSLSHLFDNP